MDKGLTVLRLESEATALQPCAQFKRRYGVTGKPSYKRPCQQRPMCKALLKEKMAFLRTKGLQGQLISGFKFMLQKKMRPEKLENTRRFLELFK